MMAPDRGTSPASPTSPLLSPTDEAGDGEEACAPPLDRSFTLRGVAVGIGIGIVLAFSNMYFGLQTGWISTMTMPASLLGYGFFKTLSRHLKFPFTPVENVLVQTVAASVGIVPLGAGFVGVIPAMNYLLLPEEKGPFIMSTWESVIWSLGLAYFGCVFAVLLRRQVIIRERLRFPSGFSTAVLIGVLHGSTPRKPASGGRDDSGGFGSLAGQPEALSLPENGAGPGDAMPNHSREWRANLRLLLTCFFASGVFTVSTYFLPILRNLPIFGSVAAGWLWTLNPSLAYVGQGVIMGPATTLHMLIGAIVGWGILSPLAKHHGWAPGPIEDWESGSKGWIVWTSLSIMLADAIVSLGYVVVGPVLRYCRSALGRPNNYLPVDAFESPFLRHPLRDNDQAADPDTADGPPSDCPPEQDISPRFAWIGLTLSMFFCVASIRYVFRDIVPLYAIVTAVLVAVPLSVIAVRAMGVTDLNPVSGISKLAQLLFGFVIPRSNKAAILINLVAGAVSESGALQAGDLMQDLKTGHLLGAAPKAQFFGQVIGASVGAVVSALVYKLYTGVYETLPNDLFQAPTALVWIFTARLVAAGKGLPPMATEFAATSFGLFAIMTAVKTTYPRAWFIPGGLAVAVGMYNVPSFTLARTIGGLVSWYWKSLRGREDTPLIIIASGFILGEGFLSVANLLLQSAGVPHL